MARGTLRIYLGAAPGVGKTFAMLGEAHRRRGRGTDVVVGIVETHGRRQTAAALGDLEVVPRRALEYRSATLEEMDVDALLARRPEVALVDELAHTNVPGSRNEKRWQDVEELLDAGIEVISTLNVQHLESLNDVVEQITGIKQRETIPDEVVRRAEQIELVDMTPEAIRRRMAHGNIYPPERIDVSLGNYFRPGNLGALRELALLWLADRVDEALTSYRERHEIDRPWEMRERVVVALTGSADGDRLVRRAARMAVRNKGELVAVHVQPQDGLTAPLADALDRQRRLVEELGGSYREIAGGDPGEALLEFARSLNATQIVLGATRRSRWRELTRRVRDQPGDPRLGGRDRRARDQPRGGNRGERVTTRAEAVRPSPPPRRARLLARRSGRAAAHVAALQPARRGLASQRAPALPAARRRGLRGRGSVAALAAAIGGFLLVNWYFTPPLYTFTVAEGENLLALTVYLAVAGVVSGFVALAARRAAEGARARAEAGTLATLAGSAPIAEVIENMRRAFGFAGAAVLHREGDGWRVDATTGNAPTTPDQAGETLEIDASHVLALAGSPIRRNDDRRILDAFARELAASIQLAELQAEVSAADTLAATNELRTAILSAVSHDLRTPLAGIKASVTSLLQEDVDWSSEERHEFLATIDEETDRLNGLVGNLLDMSRLQAGALEIRREPVELDDVLSAALRSLGARGAEIALEVPESLPLVLADAGLLERALANVIANAAAHSPERFAPRIVAGAVDHSVDVRIADRGAGVARAERERMFLPFQRLGDSSRRDGVGLGLAVAKGFVEAMGGAIEVEDTPGGGLTVIVRLEASG